MEDEKVLQKISGDEEIDGVRVMVEAIGLAYDRYVFDIACQFRFGDDVGGSSLPGLDFSQDVREHKVYMSLIVHL